MPDKKLKVLVCVSGMTPVIITETLYELVTKKKFIPDEIHVITTLVGKKEIENQLLGKNGAMAQFMSMYLPEQTILFDESTIHIPKDENGMELEDIATHDHNKIGANTTYTVMRQLKDRKAQIHASIAGGRRTMSFYMGQAFSLVADHDDTLSHVLVSSPFEWIDDFYFPVPGKIHEYDGKKLSSSDAEIMLSEVSVLKLGELIGNGLPEKAKESYDFAINVMQATFSPPKIIITKNFEKCILEIIGELIELSASQFFIFLTYAIARKNSENLIFNGAFSFDDFKITEIEELKSYFNTSVNNKISTKNTEKSKMMEKIKSVVGTSAQLDVVPVSIDFWRGENVPRTQVGWKYLTTPSNLIEIKGFENFQAKFLRILNDVESRIDIFERDVK